MILGHDEDLCRTFFLMLTIHHASGFSVPSLFCYTSLEILQFMPDDTPSKKSPDSQPINYLSPKISRNNIAKR